MKSTIRHALTLIILVAINPHPLFGNHLFPDDQTILKSNLSTETSKERLFEIATGPPVSELSLVALTILNEVDGECVVENVWWRSHDERVRKVAFFLMLSGQRDATTAEGKKIHFIKLCERFNQETKLARVSEIEEVFSGLPAIVKRHKAILLLLRL